MVARNNFLKAPGQERSNTLHQATANKHKTMLLINKSSNLKLLLFVFYFCLMKIFGLKEVEPR